MGTASIAWPRKTRELMNHHMDSTVWNDFDFRDDDVVVATYAKSGTTWTQQIVGQLLFKGAEGVPVNELSPWLDLRVPPKDVKLGALAAQTHRRCVKTHLPLDALVFSPNAKYLYIGARRPRRDLLDVQPPLARQRDVVRAAQRHARPRRPADLSARPRHQPLLPHLAGVRRLSVLVVLGEHRLLVGGARPAERASWCTSRR